VTQHDACVRHPFSFIIEGEAVEEVTGELVAAG
jgi:hypothetical protein